MDSLLLVVILGVIIALAFDFLNGFHDSANSIATVVATRVLSPRAAVLLAAVCNLGAAFTETHVAATIGKGIVYPHILDEGDAIYMVLAGLLGAIIWNLITWFFGMPSSSSHALIGGLVGAAVTRFGWGAIQFKEGLLLKVLPYIVLAPIVGFVLGRLMMMLVCHVFRKSSPRKVDHLFRRGQLLSSAIFSFSHGMNDAQKTMGIILMLLISTGFVGRDDAMPLWVKLSCPIAIAAGTYFGGWRIVRTLGLRLTKLQPVGGFCAETGGGATIVALSLFGIPLSTTHTITGAIVGVGSMQRLSAVRWGVARNIVWAWVLTIPCAAFFGALLELACRALMHR
ncbi:MAG: inorganic phosphate transporter [Acidobacteriota bacterium]|jgi:PiT family inorganic phosphate transporter|nr:inorganic phosphate transporter [Acidobacteriota bacterium]